jgi:hypothetical protein
MVVVAGIILEALPDSERAQRRHTGQLLASKRRAMPSDGLPRRTSGPADFELERELFFEGPVVATADDVEEPLHAPLAALLQRLRNGRETDVLRNLDVVEPDDREFVGDPDAFDGGGFEHPEGLEIRGGEDGGRRPG